MGRSASCFKIITCGSDSTETDDLQVPENKSSSDKRGWSFRKRSTRHRVLSNTVISLSANKESPESANTNFPPPDASPVTEKITVIQCTDEKPQLSASVESKVLEPIVVTKDENKVDDPLDESLVIVIQAAVRGFLAQRELLKLKNVVKLQAAVRGHLVRQHAVGTLRCVQAIVKMQALVRARRACLLQEGSYIEKKSTGKPDKAVSKTTVMEKESTATKPTPTYTSIEKLLSNKFARQLMESTPKTKPIHIKCDPLKPNSAWNWLERWMSVSSAEPTPKPELITEQLEREKNENLASPTETGVLSEGLYGSADSKSNPKPIVTQSKNEENIISNDADNFEFCVCHPTSSPAGDDLEQPIPEKVTASDAKEASIDTNSLPSEPTQSEVSSQTYMNSLSREPEVEGEQHGQPKRSMKRLASEQLETEGKKFVYGSRKASNPIFIATQTKYEELSSTTNSNQSFISLYEDGGVELSSGTVSPGVDAVTRTKELNMAENSNPNSSRVQYGGSECGTELSVTSTLDSPDRSEVGGAEYEHEAKISEEQICNPDITKVDELEARVASTNSVTNLSPSVTDQREKLDASEGEFMDPTVVADKPHVELTPERSVSDVQREQVSETGGLACRSSPEASPRSHITVPESQGTPASKISVKAKNRTEKRSSNQKSKSHSAGKRSPSNPNHDSGARNSVEQFPKDQKNGKRHNSIGSTRPDHADEEPRDSSSSNSLPHFMHATESARAKINANNSPVSSPDVQDRDFIKKRHSLPGVNGRQGSPRVQRSISQAQQGAKGNGGHVVHEKKWQR